MSVKISDMTLRALIDGTERVEISFDTGGGNWSTYYCTTAQIAALAQSISSEGDFDISAANETYDLDTAVAGGTGFTFRVSWSGGDGTYTFSFDNTSGRTIDGIAASEYVGEGTGHLDLVFNGSNTFQTINRGEIWDSKRNNTAVNTWNFEKHLNGSMFQWGWTFDQGTGSSSATAETARTFLIAFADTEYNPEQQLIGQKDGSDPTSRTDSVAASNLFTTCRINDATQMYTRAFHKDSTNIPSNRRLLSAISAYGSWTTLYPRIT